MGWLILTIVCYSLGWYLAAALTFICWILS